MYYHTANTYTIHCIPWHKLCKNNLKIILHLKWYTKIKSAMLKGTTEYSTSVLLMLCGNFKHCVPMSQFNTLTRRVHHLQAVNSSKCFHRSTGYAVNKLSVNHSVCKQSKYRREKSTTNHEWKICRTVYTL